MNFNKWLDTFLEEKQIDLERYLEIIGSDGNYNLIPVGIITEQIKKAPKHEQESIKKMMVKIDFINGDVLDYIGFLGKAIV